MTEQNNEQIEENVSKVVNLQNIKQSTLAEQGFQPPKADFNCGDADFNHACVDFNGGDASAGENDEQMRSGGDASAGENDEQLNGNVSKVVNLQNDEQGGTKNEEGRDDGAPSSDTLDSSASALHSQNLASLEAELAREREARALCESRLLCIGLLDEEGLPRELSDYLATSDADETEKRVRCVAQIIKNAVNEAVRARLETIKAPSRGKAEITKREFRELSLADMQRLYVTDKELYRTLTGKNN